MGATEKMWRVALLITLLAVAARSLELENPDQGFVDEDYNAVVIEVEDSRRGRQLADLPFADVTDVGVVVPTLRQLSLSPVLDPTRNPVFEEGHRPGTMHELKKLLSILQDPRFQSRGHV